ncbi:MULTISPECIES: ABC transporter ATP-binding protein [Arthrobacter]|uniref:ABC transporter ATP-binding protein n=2 Tax=Arthrobacter TaxID=1663 RepID=A0ABU9KHH0_9MICC|nr:ABC transporter ATP-binding protein [Arthrobacter sp. YJM1]MDP5226648.1 ABC transporter ATP-binding protein [Arthrobacter sp. YJM1]
MLDARALQVNGRRTDLLPPTSLRVSPGELLLVRGENQDDRTALALTLSGRMKPSSGQLSWNGSTRLKAVRKASALVDSPRINEPEQHLSVTDLVTEDLAMVPRRYRGALLARPWLKLNAFEDVEKLWVDQLTAERRVELLTQLALADPSVDLLVLDSPDRHSADPAAWLRRCEELAYDAGRPLAVVATVAALPEGWEGPSAVIGNSAPVEEEAVDDQEPAAEDPAAALDTEALDTEGLETMEVEK